MPVCDDVCKCGKRCVQDRWAWTAHDIRKRTRIISQVCDCKAVIEAIMKNEKFVGFNVVGHNLGCADPKISYVVLSFCPGEAVFFDLLMCPDMMLCGGLKELIECPKLIKVMFSCRIPNFALRQQFGVFLSDVFDLQLANAVIQSEAHKVPVECVSTVPLSYICKEFSRGPCIVSQRAIGMLQHDKPAYWYSRPIGCKAIDLAAREVMCLIPDAYYNQRDGIPESRREEFCLLTEMLLENYCDPRHSERERMLLYLRRLDVILGNELHCLRREIDVEQANCNDGVATYCNSSLSCPTPCLRPPCNPFGFQPSHPCSPTVKCMSNCSFERTQPSCRKRERSASPSGNCPRKQARCCECRLCDSHCEVTQTYTSKFGDCADSIYIQESLGDGSNQPKTCFYNEDDGDFSDEELDVFDDVEEEEEEEEEEDDDNEDEDEFEVER